MAYYSIPVFNEHGLFHCGGIPVVCSDMTNSELQNDDALSFS